jgi:hypothetical protein
VISICALIFSIIYLIKVSKIAGVQRDIKDTLRIIEEIKTILIAQCVLYSDSGVIKGDEAIKLLCDKYKCDEITAIKLYYKIEENKDD